MKTEQDNLLKAQVAVYVYGYKQEDLFDTEVKDGMLWMLPDWSTDLNHTREMEQHLAEMGLSSQYITCLKRICYAPTMDGYLFSMVTATAQIRCEAAIETVKRYKK